MPANQRAKTETVDVVLSPPGDEHADNVVLSGELNDWSSESLVLERDGEGTWRVVVAFEPGRSCRHRYLLDGEHWENHWQADRYAPNPYGSEDSVIVA